MLDVYGAGERSGVSPKSSERRHRPRGDVFGSWRNPVCGIILGTDQEPVPTQSGAQRRLSIALPEPIDLDLLGETIDGLCPAPAQ